VSASRSPWREPKWRTSRETRAMQRVMPALRRLASPDYVPSNSVLERVTDRYAEDLSRKDPVRVPISQDNAVCIENAGPIERLGNAMVESHSPALTTCGCDLRPAKVQHVAQGLKTMLSGGVLDGQGVKTTVVFPSHGFSFAAYGTTSTDVLLVPPSVLTAA
jgi:hypothetical protein